MHFKVVLVETTVVELNVIQYYSEKIHIYYKKVN